MRIDDHSYYLRYFKNAKRGESADLVYYKEVWDNGFTIDEFNIDENGLSFENANWNGINTDDSRAGTRILKRYYDRWVKLIEEARNKIVKLPTDDILIATQKGLLHINLHTMQTRVTHQDEVINDISLIGKNVNILAGDRFYVENIRGDLKQKVQLDFHANVFYNVGGAYCFLDNSQAMLSRDLKHFFTISLRRKIPMYCNNVVVTDHHSGYVMLVTENALWKVPVHQSMFNENAPIVTACCDNMGNTYYMGNCPLGL